ncbi:MAG: alpha-hydroxy acid oxidase [Pseudomonadota bacterium]|nr:alpha-hydroxy acid oxidase [Pseudomonadota bacterium]
MNDQFETTHEIIATARKNVSQNIWNYITGAAESETTLRRNRHALDCLALRPRVLRDVSEIDASTTFLGHKLRIPAMVAPVGSLQSITPEGGIAVAKAVAEFGIMNFISTVTEPSLEEIAASTDHPKFFQIYIRGDEKWVDELIDRAVKAGYAGLCLTVDSAYYGRRERQLISGWLPPSIRANPTRVHQTRITWKWMSEMKARGGDLPFMLKGIQTAEDAAKAVEHGIDVIYVSNHGGRQMDHVSGTMAMLPEIVSAVDGAADVIIDGGFMRGTDVLKAIALGAKAVGLGRFHAWALAAGGQDGLYRALEILEAEIKNSMGLIGLTSIAEIDKSFITEAPAVTEAHELGAYPFLPEGTRL